MEVIKKGRVPIYEAVCYECGTLVRCTAAEAGFTHEIKCPVCGMKVWVPISKSDIVGYQESGEVDDD